VDQEWTKGLPLGAGKSIPVSKPLVFLAGVVTEKRGRDGAHIIFYDVMLSNDEGERYVQGTAQVALPSRAA
jgi:hypothetical protein